jgi:asparaginyl-tRNA synthetase
MDTIPVAQARRAELIGQTIVLKGWVRTRRDSKGGFSFLEINDGSCMGNIQIVAPGELPNYESEIKHITHGVQRPNRRAGA